MARLIAIILFAGGLFALSGCADNEPKDPNRVSNIPWNRPEKWEGQGPMGGFTPQGGGAGY